MVEITYNGVFIDDNQDDKVNYSRLLSYLPYDKRKLKVKGESPIQIMEAVADIINGKPDIVFLDFRLDEDLASNNLSIAQAYKGGGIAQILREKSSDPLSKIYNDFPIVLISSESNIENLYDPEKTSHDLFDSCYKKEVLGDSLEHTKISKKIIALIEGYKVLNKYSLDLNIHKLLELSSNEENDDILNQQDLKQPLLGSEIPHVRARFILKNILRREGVLLSRYEIAARLGANIESLDNNILNILESCRYTGIFSQGWERWWSHLFEDKLIELVGFRPYSLTSEERIERINSHIGSSLQAAKSRWNDSNQEKSVFACTLCRQPTELKHSLSVYDSSIPKFIQKKRICFRCVKDCNYERNKIFIDDIDLRLVEEIMNMKRD